MEYISALIDFILHIDKHLDTIVGSYGGWTYLILFIIVFCETGLVVTPILPGDSLLFAAGAIAPRTGLNPVILFLLLAAAAILGDAANYAIGHFLGPKALSNPNSKIFKRQYLEKTERFYQKYGGKTIIIARFVPIVRTFAPFLAGVGTMSYARFALFNIIGGALWVACFIFAGYHFGALEVVRKNFTLVIFGIIFVSLLPALYEFIQARRESIRAQSVNNA